MYKYNSTKAENKKAEKRLAAVDEHPVRLLADYEYTIPALWANVRQTTVK